MTDEVRKISAVEPQVSRELAPAEELPTLAAGLVHEVKNPLAAIHMHLQLLEGYLGDIDDEQLRSRIHGKVDVIKSEISSLNSTLHNFLSLIRPGAGEKEVSSDLNRLVGDVVRLLEPQALREGIDLRFEPGELSGRRNLDAAFVKQIVLNLILNSIQAFQSSGPADDVHERAIHVTTGQQQNDAGPIPIPFVAIADNGPGISDEVQKQIFDPFFTTKTGQGSGLGLTLVRRMVEELGGSVELSSTPGKGARFLVLFGRPDQPQPKELEGSSAS